MNKLKIKKIEIPIYRSAVSIIIGDKTEAIKYMSKFKTSCDVGSMEYSAGKFIPCPSGAGFIYMPKFDNGILIHEILHFVTYLFHDRGVEISYQNDEAMAYMIEYVFNEYKK